MIPKLKHLAVFFLVVSFGLSNLPAALAGGLESSSDVSRELESLKSQINSLSATVENLKDENMAVKARSKEMESELATMKGLQPGTEIAKSMETRINTLEDKVGTIKISGALTGIVQSSVNRKINNSVRGLEPRDDSAATIFNRAGQASEDRTIGAGSFDLYLEAKVLENTRVYTNLEANSANQVFPSYSLPNGNTTFSTHLNDENLDVLNVLELYVESQWYDKRLTTTIGKIDLTNYFDGNAVAWDEHRQFLAGAFLDNPSFASSVPFNTIGARGSLDIGWGLTFQAAVVSIDDSGDKLFNQMYGIGEIDYQTFWFFGKEGNYRAYGYVKDVNTFDARGLLTGGSQDALGYGISIDQKITDKATGFMRWGQNQQAIAVNSFDSNSVFTPGLLSSITAGGQYEGLLPNRPNDVFGGAFGILNPANPAGTQPEQDFHEYIMEFYYNYEVKNNLHVSPVLQFMKHPNGDDDENWTVIFGGRAFLEF